MRAASDPSPFHAGEQLVQRRLGVRDRIEPWARKVVRRQLPEEHRSFYASLPFLVVAARDARGRPWATLLAGAPGFASAPDPGTLAVRARPVPGDALADRFVAGADVGILGIELATRRRNRVNGRILEDSAQGFTLAVDQSFGNCPRYIQERGWRSAARARAPARRSHDRLTPAMAKRIREADTCFIATGHRPEADDRDVAIAESGRPTLGRAENPFFGMDASHRGGAPGFVRVEGDRVLVIPDYAGNNHFNTIGNLVLEPQAGLLFVDFEGGGLLQLTGRAEIDWDSPAVARTPGARRLIRFTLEQAIELEAALPLRWDAPEEPARALRLVEKRRESEDVVSFVFASRDGAPLPQFEAGQHLPIELGPPGAAPLRRTYSLSNGPGQGRYRISVKREPRGAASRYLHDHLEVGACVNARAPAGGFVLDHGDRPVVLVSAGVGITPMLSMLHALVARDEKRPVWLVHGARDGRHHALAGEARDLAARSSAVHLHVAYSRPDEADRARREHHSEGRIDGALLASLLPDLDVEFYLCGPVAFMADLQGDLERRGVPPERIHGESFGPLG